MITSARSRVRVLVAATAALVLLTGAVRDRGPVTATASPLQAVVDAAPDGVDVTPAEMKSKLVDAEAVGFSVIDLTGWEYVDQSPLIIAGRHGLWIVQARTDAPIIIRDSSAIVISGFVAPAVDAARGNYRIEAGDLGSLTLTDVVDVMAGKLDVSAGTTITGATRVTSGQSFLRNSAYGDLTLAGLISGLNVFGSATSVVDETDPGSVFNLSVTVP